MNDWSIVIPVLNDGRALGRLLGSEVLQGFQIIVVDGGSRDDGRAVARQYGCEFVLSPAGRGRQLREGVGLSHADWIWMLHADTAPGPEAVAWLAQLRTPCWGRFDVSFTGRTRLLGLVATFMNWRSRRSGICTGDQGIFVHRTLLTSVGGVPPQSLMEDIELSKRLKREMPPVCPRIAIATSSRRWETRGVVRTIVSMWWFRLRYWLGADPERLARQYYS